MLSVAQLTGFQRDILWTLSHRGGADYGLGVKDALEAYRDEPINHGRLYPNLDSLKNKGFLTKSPLDRRTNQYALTDEAFGALADRARWQTGDENGPVGGSVER